LVFNLGSQLVAQRGHEPAERAGLVAVAVAHFSLLVNSRHAAGVNASHGPSGCFESRTATRPSSGAAAAQLEPPQVYDEVRQGGVTASLRDYGPPRA